MIITAFLCLPFLSCCLHGRASFFLPFAHDEHLQNECQRPPNERRKKNAHLIFFIFGKRNPCLFNEPLAGMPLNTLLFPSPSPAVNTFVNRALLAPPLSAFFPWFPPRIHKKKEKYSG